MSSLIVTQVAEAANQGASQEEAAALARTKQTTRDFAPVESVGVMYGTTLISRERWHRTSGTCSPRTTPGAARFGPVFGFYAGPGSPGIALIQAKRAP